ncbi:MAG: hypothetical protein ACRDRI_12710 [Pseudonocardiaceae bacterium]
MTVTSTGRTVDQTCHRLVCEALRETVRAGPGSLGRVGSIRYRASAVLYLLLLEHPIDWRGRCRSCPGILIGLRPRPCQIHVRASDWLLHHSNEALLSHLAREFGAGSVPSSGAAGTTRWPSLTVRARTHPDGIDVPSRIEDESHTDLARNPAVPLSLPVREVRETGRPRCGHPLPAEGPDQSQRCVSDVPRQGHSHQ